MPKPGWDDLSLGCVCLCVSVCGDGDTGAMQVCGGQRTTSGVGPHLPSCVRKGLFFCCYASCPGSLWSSLGLALLLNSSENTDVCSFPQLSVGSKALNLGPYTYTTGTFAH